jgi:hypothetical protein
MRVVVMLAGAAMTVQPVPPPVAQPIPQAGLWESIARTDISAAPGLDPATAVLLRRAVARPVIQRACVTAAMLAADPAAMVAGGEGCTLGPARIERGRLTVDRRCAAAGTAATLRGPVTTASYQLTGIVTAAATAPPMAMTLAIAGRRVGACPRG